MEKKEQKFDVTNCDKEPIHIPGRIQPYGFVIVVKEPDLLITQVSENIYDYLKVDPINLINKNLDYLIDKSQIQFIRAFYHASSFKHINPLPVYFSSRHTKQYFNAIFHRSDNLLVIEFEPSSGEKDMSYQTFHNFLNLTVAKQQESKSVIEMCNVTAKQIKHLTGYDRVMIYKFHKDYHGEVVAEVKEPGLEPFLGLHYPASDIPKQARELYLKNWVRMIRNVNHTPSKLFPELNPINSRPLDLSGSVLRGISPLHIEYLQNMGVGATLTISIIHQDKLWGLIACHHYSQKFVDYQTRLLAEFTGKLFSYHLQTINEAKNKAYFSQLLEIESQLLTQMAESGSVVQGLSAGKYNILDIAECDGAAFYIDGYLRTFGYTPKESNIMKLIEILSKMQNDSVFQSEGFCIDYPEYDFDGEQIFGILSLRISEELNEYIIIFKGEYIESVDWAGNPDKSVNYDPNTKILSPRKSFEKWVQEIRGKSAPWEDAEIEIASNLREHIIDIIIRNTSEIKLLNKKLEYTNSELEQRVNERTKELVKINFELKQEIKEKNQMSQKLKHAKDIAEEMSRLKSNFLANISHEIRTPLNGIIGMTQLIEETNEDVTTQSYINVIKESSDRLLKTIQNIIQISRIESEKIEVDHSFFKLDEAINQIVKDYKEKCQSKGLTITYTNTIDDTKIFFDLDKFNFIIDSLIDNAFKFTEKGSIKVLSSQENIFGNDFIIIDVVDTGSGIPESDYDNIFIPFHQLSSGLSREQEGSGLGLPIAKKFVEIYDGFIEIESELGKGTKISVKFSTINVKK